MHTRLLFLIGMFVLTGAVAQANDDTLTFSPDLKRAPPSVMAAFRLFFLLRDCNDYLPDIPSALRHPESACEIFVTKKDPVVIPEDISSLLFLTSLAVDGPDSVTVADAVWTMPFLRELQLKGAGLQSVPTSIASMKRLTILGLSDNNLTTLPDEIADLPRLRTLFLRENPISKEEQRRIREMLPNVTIHF